MDQVYIVLLATGLVGGVCTTLAGLLLVAERYLANYGPCAIDINQGAKKLEVKGGGTLLASLMAQGIFIPSACGGRGTCAYCKLKVIAGGGQVAPTEKPLLSQREIADQVRISCQVKVRTDLAVVIPEELFLVRDYTGVVEKITDLTHDIKQLRIRLLNPPSIEFKSGQYIQLETQPYAEVSEPVYRAYSMSSPATQKNNLELIVRLVPEGICTTWVFTVLKEGREVHFNGPYGKFGMTGTDKPMVWIAGGSGMAPFWSMIRQMQTDHVQRECTYFFGAVQNRDLFLVDELRQMEKEMPNFHFIPALSQPAADDNWSGEKGLITEAVNRRVENFQGKEFYLCGSSGMIDASIKVLQAKGVTQEHIFYDKFT